jgi:hypothetical protein
MTSVSAVFRASLQAACKSFGIRSAKFEDFLKTYVDN